MTADQKILQKLMSMSTMLMDMQSTDAELNAAVAEVTATVQMAQTRAYELCGVIDEKGNVDTDKLVKISWMK